MLPEGATADSAAQPTEERPRLRRYVGSPVPATADADAGASAGAVPTDMPATKGTGPTEPTPAPIAPPPPRAIPPEGGFQAQAAEADEPGGPLALLKRRPALPVVLAGGIAALIGFLALRKRR